jgi:DNA invertase Pin-like site-specific DNA recombinase
MHNSDLITPQHLARKAIIYIRQSTPHQVVSHQESLRLQYALGERARQLGWPDESIDIIDDDLGLTAATAHHRAGFNTLVAHVTLEQVGLILSYDVTRLVAQLFGLVSALGPVWLQGLLDCRWRWHL